MLRIYLDGLKEKDFRKKEDRGDYLLEMLLMKKWNRDYKKH